MGNLQSSPSSSNTTLMKKYDVFLSFRGADTRDCFTSHLYEALRRKQIETFIDNEIEKGDELSSALMTAIKESKISVVIFSKDYATAKWCLRELVEILKCKKMNNQIVLPVFYGVDPSVVRNQTGSFNDSFVEHEKNLPKEVKTWRKALTKASKLSGWHSSKGRLPLHNVRHQTGSFKDSFVKHETNLQKEVKTWREALAEASVIKGWHSSVGRTDATLVNEIVNDIRKKLMSEYIPSDFGELIGLEPRIEHIISLLCLHVTTDVRIIGILGMGGIGKTTLAKAIFNHNSNQFEGVCFFENVRERLEKCGGLVSVKEEILSKVLKDGDLKLDSSTVDPKIYERLNRLKVFIVLDDVDDFIQMETLVKGVGGLGQGSRIIITSRDKQVLRNCRVNDDNIYEVKGLNFHGAHQLFCKYAFDEYCHSVGGLGQRRRIIKTSTYLQVLRNCRVNEYPMVNRLVNFMNGNPLALKVLGSSLYKKSNEEWESVVNKFKMTNLIPRVFDVLKISYDGLTDIEKGIFLDIACFLKGRKQDYVAKILDDCQYSLKVLIDKYLITIASDNTIKMHDLLEEMGRDIVNKESPNEIGKRSRLWRQEDVLCTLTNDDGTPEVQGIVLNMIEINKDIHLSSQVFKKMYNLRLLKFYDSTHPTYSKFNGRLLDFDHSTYPAYYKVQGRSLKFCNEGLIVLSNKLRSLIWYGYPLQALPSNFNPNNLVELDLRGSNLERLWEDCMDVPKLRWLNLSGCTRVTKIPDLSKSPLLERIYLQHCSSLLDFPQLAQHLKNLRYLDRRGCNSLRSFPSDIHFESLTSLDLSNCNNLTKFPQISGNIILLDLSGTAIEELPHSIGHVNGLKKLFLRRCGNLHTLPSSICKLTSLRHLDLSDCSRLEILPENLGNLKSLEYLSMKRAAIKELPHSIGLLNGLKKLFLRRCGNLDTLPSSICKLTSLRHLDLSDCSRLEILPENLGNLKSLEYLSVKRAAIKELPHSIAHLNGLEELFLGGCKNLETLPSGIRNLTSLQHLDLSNCSRLEILPENLGNLNSLEYLCVKRAAIKELPHSIAHLNGLEELFLGGCKNHETLPSGIRNLTSLQHLDASKLSCRGLSACDCKQLQSIPNGLDFARKPTEFIFTNCMNLEETAVGNMLARLVKYRYQGYTNFTFCYPGSEVPKWFRYTTEGSSIKFQKTFDRIHKGFAVCAVIAFEKYLFNDDRQHKLGVHFQCRCSGGAPSSSTYNIMSETAYVASRNRTLIDSDHVAFACLDASNHRLLGEQIKNFSFLFRLTIESPNCRLKSCGVCPIYYQDSDTDDSDAAGTRGSRFYEEEMEPHPKENENLQTMKYAEPIQHIGETSGNK